MIVFKVVHIMINKFIFKILIIILFVLANQISFAEDTVVVQTLTFDDIMKRRGMWKFPDDANNFRKILLFYTLKCDPRTPWDKYNCGEWDYLTYNMVHQHTGKYDSMRLQHPYFKIGVESPDTLEYTLKETFTNYQKRLYKRIVDGVISESEYKIYDSSSNIEFSNKRNRMQFVVTKSELEGAGFTKGAIDKIKLFVEQAPVELKNFKIRMKNTVSKETSVFDNDNLTEVFYNSINIDTTGWYEILFTTQFQWLSFLNLLVEISFDHDDENSSFVVSSIAAPGSVYSGYDDSYLKFDGLNDFVDCGFVPELNQVQRFTFECWLNVNQWKANSKIMGIGDQLSLELGSQQGDINCVIRNPDNTYGYSKGVLGIKVWQHIAMVYDGTKSDNSSKLKLYINGIQQSLVFTGALPENTGHLERTFTVGGNDYSNKGFDGALDEVRVWQEALDENTINEWKGRQLAITHPGNSNLILYFNFDQTPSNILEGGLNSEKSGVLIGVPEWRKYSTDEIFREQITLNEKPILMLVRGEYEAHLDTTVTIEKVRNSQISISFYGIENYLPNRKDILYVYRGGWSYTYNPEMVPIDSVFVANDKVIYNYKLDYWGKPYEILEAWEIGRFITPYGIGLDLGPDGFTWVYDVTDYAPLLQGNVELSGGNLQELIDMKFVFYKGIPPRYVKNINRVWGPMQSYSYKSLSEDSKLSETRMTLHPEAKQFKIKTRLTGHGHNSNDGSYPHCCEWKDNTHYLFINGNEAARWHIFQYDDCALNPVFPQGGTWPGAREGWCPGDVVKENEFEVTDIISGSNQVTLDYDITKVPENNQGMGNGNYVINVDLIEYSEPNHNLDAEIYDVIMPNNFEYYSRKNPICTSPIIVVRNNGVEPITSITFDYSVSGGNNENYIWRGLISPMEKEIIVLPISGSKFWIGDGSNRFKIKISYVNGKGDEYSANDFYTTNFNMPDLYNQPVVLHYRTNRRPQDYTYIIKDMNNNVVFFRTNLNPETLYIDTLNISDGCYTLEFTDRFNLGLSYWAYPDQGSGYLRIYSSTENKLLKSFNPDCGKGYIYSFNSGNINYVVEPGYDYLLNLYPNPTNGDVVMEVDYEMGNCNVQLFDLDGNMVHNEKIYIGENFRKIIHTSQLPIGTYYIKLTGGQYNIAKSFVKK